MKRRLHRLRAKWWWKFVTAAWVLLTIVTPGAAYALRMAGK